MTARRPLFFLPTLAVSIAAIVGACGGGDVVMPDAVDATVDVDTAGDTTRPIDSTTPACAITAAAVAGTDRLSHTLGVASVAITGRDTCTRSYQLASTAVRRDDLPASPRTIVERSGDAILRSGHDMFDALHALAMDEVHENEVATITDGAFGGGAATPCGDAGCFETGKKWTYVWTRDTSYAVDLALAALDPARAASSLRFKLSPTRDGDALQIVQDTGSGGSYPVSSDRVVWALGARAVLQTLPGEARTSFRAAAFEALANTVERDRQVVFDAATGLYRGETSFLDWREQTYGGWTQNDVVDIASSAALGTNVLHLHALRLTAELADALGDGRGDRFRGWAEALRTAIRERLWLDDAGMFSSFLPTTLDVAPVHRFDLLAESLAILHGVATLDEARRIVASYRHYGPGAPVIWPQQQYVAIYHNRAEWPFVDAYWLRAARVAKNDAVTDRMVRALMRGAALNLSNMESFEARTGSPDLDDGTFSGPVVNSQRQLWSVAGYLAMVHGTLFGLAAHADGLSVDPWITRGLRRDLFAGSDQLVLADYPHRGARVTVVVRLPPIDAPGLPGGRGAYRVASRTVDGVLLSAPAGSVVADALIHDGTRIEVVLEDDPEVTAGAIREPDPSDWQALFGPRTPQLKSVTAADGKLVVTIGPGDEPIDGLAFDLYRDGVRVAAALPGTTTTWTDSDSDASAGRSPCYALDSHFIATGNHSQRTRAVCWWGAAAEAIQLVDASALQAVGGTGVTAYGRFFYQDWGDANHTLTARQLHPTRSGPHLVQVTYGNGAGPINTGIACGVKRVQVFDEADDTLVGSGVLVMPQLGSWDRWALSTFVPVTLDAAHSYRVVIGSDAATLNMSALSHFASYTGATGGRDGPFSRVNIAELRLLAR